MNKSLASSLLSFLSMNFARIKSRIYQLIAITTLLLSSFSTEAALLCQQVFLTSETFRESTLFKTIPTLQKAVDSYKTSTKSPAEKASLEKTIALVETQITTRLQTQGIAFKTENFKEEVSDLKWQIFVIEPAGPHWLNKMALSLKTKYGVSLILNPVYKAIESFDAAYMQEEKIIILSEEVLFRKQASASDIHEIIHAFFHAQRDGRASKTTKAPVNIRFFSEKDIDPGTKIPVYQKYMNYEEMVTFSYNISHPAIQARKTDLSLEEMTDIAMRILQLGQISLNVRIASQHGLTGIEQNKSFTFDVGTEKILTSAPPGPIPYVEVWIPKHIDAKSEKDFAISEIQKARRLAEFNLQYFKDMATWNKEQFIEKAANFRGVQKEFIDSL